MEAQYKQEEDCTESVTCVYSVEEVNKAFDRAVRSFASSSQVDGFRKGKVPASIIEKRAGEDLLYRVVNILSDSIFTEVRKAKGILLSTSILPSEEEDELNLPKRGETYTLTYTYKCIPEVDLPEYENISMKLEQEAVTEDEVQKSVREFLRQTLPLEDSTNEMPTDGDITLIDLTIFEGDTLLGSQKDHSYSLPSETFLKPLEPTIRSMKKGEKKKITIEFPSSESLESVSIFSGKTCIVDIELRAIQTVPSIEKDVEIIKKIGYSSYDEFILGYKKFLQEYKDASVKEKLRKDIVSSIANRVETPVPSMLVDLYMDALLDNFESIAEAQGFNLDLLTSGFEHIVKVSEKLAKDMAKNQVVLLNIAKKEDISVTDTEFAQFIHELAKQAGVEPAKLYKDYQEADMLLVLYQRLLADKVGLYLYNKAISADSTEKVSKEKTIKVEEKKKSSSSKAEATKNTDATKVTKKAVEPKE